MPTPARAVACPTCQAKPGDPCTRPIDKKRVEVPWHHLARNDVANGWT